MHCIARAWERYAITLTPDDVRALERQIQNGQALVVRREAEGTTVYLVRHQGDVMVAVYGRERNGAHMRIITFLPEDAVKGGNQDRRFWNGTDRALKGGRHRRQHKRNRVAVAYA